MRHGQRRRQQAIAPPQKTRTRDGHVMTRRKQIAQSRSGWTMLELLTAVAIVSLLLQLLLPAVQSAREAARRLQCSQHMRQIGLAVMLHHDALGYYPSGGWHFHWIGEPERGTDPAQPGSWIFNLLDYVEQSELRRVGWGRTGSERAAALTQRCQTPLGLFLCPSRRDVDVYPHRENPRPLTQGGRLAQSLEWAAKTDYAANAGDQPLVEYDWRWPGPQSLQQGDDARFRWPASALYTGVIYGRSQVRQRNIRDGLAHTYLIGEKYIDAARYTTGDDWGDNENLYCGFNNDVCRSTALRPCRDQAGREEMTSFGSAHAHVWQAVFCDGSVRAMSYTLDPQLHQQLGNRRDRRPATGWSP